MSELKELPVTRDLILMDVLLIATMPGDTTAEGLWIVSKTTEDGR